MDKAAGGVVFDRVSKRYGDVTAVDEVSFNVKPAQLCTLLGPSGCGKTTTLRMDAGLEPVSGGRIMIGLGFKVTGGGRYTDLDGKNPGTFAVNGETVSFKGGHLGGQSGRALSNGNFRIGAQASCEPY